MKTWNAVKVIGAVAVATVIMAAQARAIVAYDYTGVVGNLQFNQADILGNIFTVNSAINVTAVGAFTSSGSFGAATVQVAIYQLTSGTWGLTTTVESFSGSGSSDHGARMQDLSSPVTLTPGGIYAIVAANYDVPGAPYWANVQSGPPSPTFNSDGGIISIGDGGSPTTLVYTYTLGATLPGTLVTSEGPGSLSTPNFGAGTFEFAPVPEAATFGAAGVGLLALVYIGRYARLRSKVTPA
jgi:hypothetical protein